MAAGLIGVIDELREISRGIHPAILSSEVGAYYVVSEMLTNAAKHARASVVEVDAEAVGGTLRVCAVTTVSAAPTRYAAQGWSG